MHILKNKCESNKQILISIITPNFNRRDQFLRSFKSVQNLKTNLGFELIIVDDGSQIDLSKEYEEIISYNKFPITIFFKENGGVHTARNLGTNNAKGDFCIFLDSDDELLPDSLDIFMEAYSSLSPETKKEIFEIKAMCATESGIKLGKNLPTKFNDWKPKKQKKWINKNCGEMIGFRKTFILKNNNFPEPENVKFVSENILWFKLREKYKSYYIDNVVRIYHTETGDSLTKTKHKSIQHCYNRVWNYQYFINQQKLNLREMITSIAIYQIFKYVLEFKGIETSNFFITSLFKRIMLFFLKPICKIYAYKYIKNHSV